jgi:glutamate/tyrosine decarboxylase-like PLP-dependent enzyme
VEADGLRGAPEVEIFVTEEAHYSIERAARMLGLGSKSLRRVPTDDQGRMRPADLEAMMKASKGPAIVSAQVGNVNTGAFDPLDAIADLAAERDAWLHVDGAFGLWAALSPARAALLSGIDRASSIATDAHKWLNVPYDCGMALCARPEVLRKAMTLAAPYIMDSDSERDPHEYVPDESRRARAIPVYAVMRSLGVEGLRAMIEQSCDVARRMSEQLGKVPGVRVLNDVVLNQALIRFEASGVDPDDLTSRIITRLQASGTCWFGGTRWKEMTAMRISVSSVATTLEDADRSVEAIRAAFDAERG